MNSLKCKKNHLKTILGGLFLSRYNPPYGCWVGVQQVEEFFFLPKIIPLVKSISKPCHEAINNINNVAVDQMWL